MDVQTKREREKTMVSEMIALYCRKNHGTKKKQLCEDCTALEAYARLRSDKCPFMETKTFCSNCRVHCYPARNAGENSARYAFFRPTDAFSSSGDGDSSCDRIQEREKTAGKGRNEIKICRHGVFRHRAADSLPFFPVDLFFLVPIRTRSGQVSPRAKPGQNGVGKVVLRQVKERFLPQNCIRTGPGPQPDGPQTQGLERRSGYFRRRWLRQ